MARPAGSSLFLPNAATQLLSPPSGCPGMHGNRSRPYAEGSGRLRRNVTRIPGSQMVNSNPRSVANFSIASNRKDEVFSSGGKKRPSSCSKTMQNFRVFRRSSMCSERASMPTTKQEAGWAINRDNAYSDSVIGRHNSLHARASRRWGSPTRRRLSTPLGNSLSPPVCAAVRQKGHKTSE